MIYAGLPDRRRLHQARQVGSILSDRPRFGCGIAGRLCADHHRLAPIRFGLLFERFLNPSVSRCRTSTSTFCQDRRGEVIDYVQTRNGRESGGRSSPSGRWQARGAARSGRVLQMPYGQVDN